MNDIHKWVNTLFPEARLFSHEVSRLCKSLTMKYKEKEGLMGFVLLSSVIAYKTGLSEDSFVLLTRLVFRKVKASIFIM